MNTDNLTLRYASAADAKELLEIYTPYVKDTAITFEYEVPSIDEFSSRIEKITAKYPYIAAEYEGKIVGYAYAGTFKDRAAYDWCVETSIYVRTDCRNMGIGRILLEKLEELLKAQGILNVNACIACTDNENEHLTNASVYFHEKMGYSPVGKFTKCGYKYNTWYDMVWMEKIIGEHKEIQPKVIPFQDII